MKAAYKLYLLSILQAMSMMVFGQGIDSIPKANQREILLHAKSINEDRTIWIHLPSGYNTSAERYPVLYLLDGGSHFKYVSEMVDYLSNFELNYMPQMIIVGIPNTDRGRDLAPVFNQGVPNGAAGFFKFIQSELIPYVDKNFRTQPFRILEGHSLGGLFGIYAMPLQPDLFQASIIISPALFGGSDKEKVMNDYKIFLKKDANIKHKMYVTLGNEGTEGTDILTQQLKQSAPKSFRWRFKKYDDENHFSIPYKSMYDGLRFIYANWHADIFLNPNAMSYPEIENHYRKLSEEFGYTIDPSEDLLNQSGYTHLRYGHFDKAFEFFQQNIKRHPESFNAYDSMGEAYMLNGQDDLAIQFYQKSIDLNPRNENGKRMIEKLKRK